MIEAKHLEWVYKEAESVVNSVYGLGAFCELPLDDWLPFSSSKKRFPPRMEGTADHYLWAFDIDYLNAINRAKNLSSIYVPCDVGDSRECGFQKGQRNLVDEEFLDFIALANGRTTKRYKSLYQDWTGDVRTVLEVVMTFDHHMDYLHRLLPLASKSVKQQLNELLKSVNDYWWVEFDSDEINQELAYELIRAKKACSGHSFPAEESGPDISFFSKPNELTPENNESEP